VETLLYITKSSVLVYFFLIFCGIIFWTFRTGNKERFERYRKIPFLED